MAPLLINSACISGKKRGGEREIKDESKHMLQCTVNVLLDLMRFEAVEKGITKKKRTFHLDATPSRSPNRCSLE